MRSDEPIFSVFESSCRRPDSSKGIHCFPTPDGIIINIGTFPDPLHGEWVMLDPRAARAFAREILESAELSESAGPYDELAHAIIPVPHSYEKDH